MNWKAPDEIGDVLLLAAGALTVCLLFVTLTLPLPAEQALSFR